MAQHDDDQEEVELDPKLVEILDGLEDDRKKLLRDKNFQQAPQLRQWIAQFMVERLIQFGQFFGLAFEDAYSFSVSNLNEVRRLRKFTIEQFKKLGVDIPRDELPGPDEEEEELIDAMQESFSSLANLLSDKIPDDPDIAKALEDLNECMTDVVEELMPYTRDDDDDDADEKKDDADEKKDATPPDEPATTTEGS